MAVFAYKAIDLDTSAVSGTIVADTPRQARDLLRERGLTIQDVTIRQARRAGGSWSGRSLGGRRHGPKLVSMIRELSTLLAVGIPLLEAIDHIARQHKGHFRECLLLLRDRVSAGMSLADAMAEQPDVFNELAVSITQVGESSGTLDTALERLAEFKERASQLKGRIATALIYPCIVLLTGIAVSLFLMSFVVPNLLSALIAAGKPLPWTTQVVKSISDFILHQWWVVLLSVVSGSLSVAILLRTDGGRRLWHRLQLHLPILGDMVRKQAILRIAVVMGTLLRSGIVFIKSVQIARQGTKNGVIRDALIRFENAVGAGQDIAEALAATDVFPPLVVQIFAVGQQSGRLEEMLDRLATDYDRQLTTASQRLTAVLEPILILFLALIVGFIAFATVMPILEAGNVL